MKFIPTEKVTGGGPTREIGERHRVLGRVLWPFWGGG